MAPRTLLVGPYLLVRPHRQPHLRIYEVYNPEMDDSEPKLATLWAVDAPEFGIPEEWRVRCELCQEPPSPSRAESISKAFYDRDKALRWLRQHRTAKHPGSEAE
jgi:hypothetical protein